MTPLNTDDNSATVDEGPPAVADHDDSVIVFAVASFAVSGLGFLTLLKLVDRTDRTPTKALGLFLATSFETISGAVLGLVTIGRASDSKRPGNCLVLGASGAGLGFVTTLLNFSWMRTRRRL